MTRSAAQKALYTRLLDTEITALLSTNWGTDAVFAQVPEKKFQAADFPFVSIARGASERMDDKTNDGQTYRFQVDVWGRSWADVEQIADMATAKLHREEMTMDDAQVVSVDVFGPQLQTEQDQKTRRAILDVQIMATRFVWLLRGGGWDRKGAFGGVGTWGDT